MRRVWIALLLLLPHALLSQVQPLRAVVDGLVTDTAYRPLIGATAEVEGFRVRVRTGENGRFRITALPAGDYVVVVRRLGYAPYSATLALQPGDTVRPLFVLRTAVAVLDTMIVTEVSAPERLREFESRRALGVGQFMTSEQIRHVSAMSTSDVLRTFQSVAVQQSSVLNTRGFGTRQCPYRIFVDGVPVAPRDLDADLPPPSDLAGIEVHQNSATIPDKYATFGGVDGSPHGGAECGVILFWTKR